MRSKVEFDMSALDYQILFQFILFRLPSTPGSFYRYSTDNETPLSDSQLVHNLSVNTLLLLHCTDKAVWAKASFLYQ